MKEMKNDDSHIPSTATDSRIDPVTTISFTRWAETFDRMSLRPAAVLQSREEEFLELGAKLQEFAFEANRVARSALQVSELTSGDSLDSSISALTREMDRLHEVISLESSQQSLEELEKINVLARRLDQMPTDFKRVVKSLQMLGISTRIESARLGSMGRGFTTLADDVEKLANNIIANITQIADKNRFLQHLVQVAKQKTGDIVGVQQGCSSEIFSTIRSNLDKLVSITEQSASVSRVLPERSQRVSRNISEVVSSLQFHDIVRQQVEHVQEAFEDVQALFESKQAESTLDEEAREAVGWMVDVCELQVGQLENAKKRFLKAVESIRSNLGGVGGNVRDLGLEIQKAILSEKGGSVLESIESSIASVSGSMNEFAMQAQAMGEILNDVTQTIYDMSTYVNDIEEVGSEIELIALNASVKAAHTGEEGRALGVLAKGIQNLSVDARAKTKNFSSVLHEVGDSSNILQVNAESYLEPEQVREELDSIEKITADLRKLNEEVSGAMNDIAQRVERLGGEIDTATETIDMHQFVAEDLEALKEEVRDLVRRGQEIVPDQDEARRSERLREMLERYTMDAERIVHLSTFGNSDSEKTADSEDFDLFSDTGDVEMFEDNHPKSEFVEEDEDMDENVELF